MPRWLRGRLITVLQEATPTQETTPLEAIEISRRVQHTTRRSSRTYDLEFNTYTATPIPSRNPVATLGQPSLDIRPARPSAWKDHLTAQRQVGNLDDRLPSFLPRPDRTGRVVQLESSEDGASVVQMICLPKLTGRVSVQPRRGSNCQQTSGYPQRATEPLSAIS